MKTSLADLILQGHESGFNASKLRDKPVHHGYLYSIVIIITTVIHHGGPSRSPLIIVKRGKQRKKIFTFSALPSIPSFNCAITWEAKFVSTGSN